MPEQTCALCGNHVFYIKDPDDAWQTWKFRKKGDRIEWLPEEDQPDPPELSPETKIFCDNCAWQGRFKDIC